MRYSCFICTFFILSLISCKQRPEATNTKIEDIAGNDEVLQYMKTFDGRGDLSDSAKVISPQQALALFKVPGDLAIDLVLSEPKVTQPVFMTFDSRGRLWVVQYDQYPYPKGLKVTSMDQHLRAQFDKIPLPPPQGQQGADKISVFEDTDGDGTFEKADDVITGLNIATSVAFGRGKIWVLNPPYLLAYPDPDGDGHPDGPAVVHLKGFGIEDTHAVANNLRWGPDGWLYGAQGSTCTADVSSDVTKHVRFNGQAIWRYNTETKVFEVFAEGGGNTFDIEIDEKGRLYSGDNGYSHGQYYKQGGYYPRNLGKHGAYTNPYTFGRLENMALKGEEIRFTHAFVRYEGGALPAKYNEQMIAINPLQGYVQLYSFDKNGSSFSNSDGERIVQTSDRSFRPVDIVSGPDGSVYIADWYDSRLSHVDPRDTWSKTTGRIYRLRNKRAKPGLHPFNLLNYSETQLVSLLTDKNNWYRQQALQEIANRKSSAFISLLMPHLTGTDGQAALEALWAINLCGGFNEAVSKIALAHNDPFVRMWGARLIGDLKNPSATQLLMITDLASKENDPEVQSQLAASAKRLPADACLAIVRNLASHADASDPDIPMQLWWSLESKAISDRGKVVSMFEDKSVWDYPIVNKTLLSRLMERYAISGNTEDLATCTELLKLAPADKYAGVLINGLEEGLRGREANELPTALLSALHPYQKLFSDKSLALNLRRGDDDAAKKALNVIADRNAQLAQRLSYIKIFGEIDEPKSVPVLLSLIGNGSSPAIQQAALVALQRYNQKEIGQRVIKAYPDQLRADPDVRVAALSLFATRTSWAMDLLNAIGREKRPGEQFIGRTVDKSDVPPNIIQQIKLLNDNAVTDFVNKIWPEMQSGAPDASMAKVMQAINAGKGNAVAGHAVFVNTCGVCHKLFDEGGNIGPNLTGYDRSNLSDLITNIVDPNAFIREGYGAFHVETTDGRKLVGTLKSNEGNTITIQPFSGEPITLGKTQVKNMEAQKTSLMPEHLLDNMNDQQVRDLMAYISQKKG
jgi:putative heme-binding domain-containing protein